MAAAAAIYVVTAQTPALWEAVRRSAFDGAAQSARGNLSGTPVDIDPAPEPLALNDMARSGATSGRRLILLDGSQVEMRAATELRVERADVGLAIRLHTGSIIVNAAKQGNGHLYAKTKDMTVAVIGTVLLVATEDDGSRVAVIAGEARLSERGAETNVGPGEQLSTSRGPAAPLRDEIAWSRNADAYLRTLASTR